MIDMVMNTVLAVLVCGPLAMEKRNDRKNKMHFSLIDLANR
jgi:hypothetical protein